MKASHLALGTLGAFVAWSLITKAKAKASAIAKPPALGDYIDPYALGMGCTMDLGCLAGTGCYGDSGLGCGDGVGCMEGMDGLGRFSLRKAVQKVTAPVQHVLKRVSAPVVKQVKKDLKRVAAPVVKQLKRDAAFVQKSLKRDLAVATFKPLRKKGGGSGGSDAGGEQVVYQDADGNVISEAQYNALVNAQTTSDPNQAVLPNPDQQSISYSDADAESLPMPDSFDDQGTAVQDDPMTAMESGDAGGGQSYQDDAYLQLLANQTASEDQGAQDIYDQPTAPIAYQRPTAPSFDNDDQSQDSGEDPAFSSDDVAAPADPDVAFIGTEIQGNTMDDPYAVRDDWSMDGLGALADRQTGRRLAVVRRRPGRRLEATPLHADRHGQVYAYQGGTLHHLGHVDGLAGAEGLGFSLFGRSFGQIRNKVVKAERRAHDVFDPVAMGYKQLTKNEKWYRRYRRADKAATPYLLIAGGTALSVATLGAGSAAGAVAIASGVAEIGAQAYADKKRSDANRAYDAAGGDAGAQAAIDEAALQSAGHSAVYGDSFPDASGAGYEHADDNDLLTIGEVLP